jgi:hypothetical protein
MMVDFIENNDYIKVKGVEFRDGAKSFEARISSGGSGGKIEIRLDSQTGKLVGTCEIKGTGGWDKWETKICDISGASGKHDVFFKFTGATGSLFNFNWWKFTPINPESDTRIQKQIGSQNGFSVSAFEKLVTLKLDLTSVEQQNTVVGLYCLSGRLVSSLFQGAIGRSGLTLDLKTIPSGTYLVKVVTDHSIMTKTINLQ